MQKGKVALCRISQTLKGTEVPWASCVKAASDSVKSGVGPELCVADKLLGVWVRALGSHSGQLCTLSGCACEPLLSFRAAFNLCINSFIKHLLVSTMCQALCWALDRR